MQKSLAFTSTSCLKRFCSYKPVSRSNILKVKKQKEVNNAVGLEMPSIVKQLQSKITVTGPITIAEYMKEVLTNPNSGYYMTKDVFGHKGDFITSPEIGQIFGELVAVWCYSEWQKIGAPSPFQLIELGPGRGTLAKDMLRVLTHYRLGKQFSLHLVEVSPVLSKIQAQRLCYQHAEIDSDDCPYYQKGETVSGVPVFWYRKLEDIPKEFSILVAHEFFDALPIHKLQKVDGSWKEILIDIDPAEQNKFRFIMSRSQTPVSKIFKPVEGENRELLEYSLETDTMLQNLVLRFEEEGGFALIMDYGHFGDKTDTFRAFKNHQLHDPLFEPGTADLTADVDFKYLKSSVQRDGKLITFGPVEQGTFIKNMEGDARLQVLLENTSQENRDSIKSGYEMLTHPDQMGKRFKFFSIFPSILEKHLKRFPVSGFH